MRAIILVCDQPDLKKEGIENRVTKCFCCKNNSVDRAKILIRYLRKKLFFQKHQIIFLRASKFSTPSEILEELKSLINQYQNEDLIFYYSGHGIAGTLTGLFSDPPCLLFKVIKKILEIIIGDRPGWSMGDPSGVRLYYDQFPEIFKSFKGRLIFINDCCHALSIDPYLKKILKNRYLLFGSSRNDSTSRISILDAVLGPWSDCLPAFPWVYAVAQLRYDHNIDFPMYCFRGSYYDCDCGIPVKNKKIFLPEKRPLLRRGAQIDYLCYPIRTKP